MSTRRPLFAASLLAALVACNGGRSELVSVTSDGTDVGVGEEGPLEEGFWTHFDATDGCADTTIHAWEVDGLTGLELTHPGFIEGLAPGDEPTRKTLDIATDDVDILVEVGEAVSINYCTDALSEREVWGSYVAIEGSVVLEALAPANPDEPVPVDVDLWNVLLVGGESGGDGRHEVLISHLELNGVSVMQAWGG